MNTIIGQHAVIFARVSSTPQATEGASIPAQLQAIGQFMETNYPGTACHALTHCGSAYNVPAAEYKNFHTKILTLYDETHSSCIVVTRMNRISRNVEAFCTLLRKLEERGGFIVALEEDVSTRTPAGRARAITLITEAEKLLRDSVDQVTAAKMAKRAIPAHYAKPAPFGCVKTHEVVDGVNITPLTMTDKGAYVRAIVKAVLLKMRLSAEQIMHIVNIIPGVEMTEPVILSDKGYDLGESVRSTKRIEADTLANVFNILEEQMRYKVASTGRVYMWSGGAVGGLLVDYSMVPAHIITAVREHIAEVVKTYPAVDLEDGLANDVSESESAATVVDEPMAAEATVDDLCGKMEASIERLVIVDDEVVIINDNESVPSLHEAEVSEVSEVSEDMDSEESEKPVAKSKRSQKPVAKKAKPMAATRSKKVKQVARARVSEASSGAASHCAARVSEEHIETSGPTMMCGASAASGPFPLPGVAVAPWHIQSEQSELLRNKSEQSELLRNKSEESEKPVANSTCNKSLFREAAPTSRIFAPAPMPFRQPVRVCVSALTAVPVEALNAMSPLVDAEPVKIIAVLPVGVVVTEVRTGLSGIVSDVNRVTVQVQQM
jgi:DNA invertase Pin-like site-specific DNA recombinase